MRMRPLPKLKLMRRRMQLLPKPMRMRRLPKQMLLLPMPNFPLPVMVSQMAIIGPTNKVVVVVVLVTEAAVVALVMVVVETMAEAVADKARFNFVFSSTNIGNTYTYTSPCDRFEKERQNQSVSGERERIVSSRYSVLLYHLFYITKVW